MPHLHGYAENAAAALNTETLLGAAANITIPAGRRGVIRRVDAWYLGALDSVLRLRTNTILGAILFTAQGSGVGSYGGECFVFVNAIAAAVVVVPTITNGNATTATGAAIAAFVE